MSQMFRYFIPTTKGPWTEAEKQESFDGCLAHAMDILVYNRSNPNSCVSCIEVIVVRELNEIVDEFWPTDATKQVGLSYDADADKYSINLKGFG